MVQGDDLGAGPIPGAGGASSAGIAAGNGGGARPNGGGGDSGGGGEADKAAPVIYKNLIILGSASGFLPPPGRPADVRAYDLHTGKLVWQNRLVPDPGQPGADSWADPDQVLGSSSWGFLSLDEATGTVYVPTDSGSPDLVGIWRPGDNKWADSTVALDAMTGKIKWGFQNNRHDVWDMDTMAAPVPVTITKDGKKIKAIVQTTKQGQVWILECRYRPAGVRLVQQAGGAEQGAGRKNLRHPAFPGRPVAGEDDHRPGSSQQSLRPFQCRLQENLGRSQAAQ